MPQAVVDALEVIDVEHHHRERRSIENRTIDEDIQALIKITPVGKPCEVVGVHLAVECGDAIDELVVPERREQHVVVRGRDDLQHISLAVDLHGLSHHVIDVATDELEF